MVAVLPLELYFDFLIQHSVTFSWKGCFNLGTKRWVSIIIIRVMTSKKKKRIAERVAAGCLTVLLLIIPCHPSFWKTNSFSAELQFTGGGRWPRVSFTQSKHMRRSGSSCWSWPWWSAVKREFQECSEESPLAFCFHFTINRAMNGREICWLHYFKIVWPKNIISYWFVSHRRQGLWIKENRLLKILK